MQNIKESVLSTCRKTTPLWLRYFHFCTTRRSRRIPHINEQNTDIQFIREVEENGKLPFLDCLVSRDDNSLWTTVYRKPTTTDRLLDESSYNPTSHKATTIRTLTRRVQLICNTTDSLSDKNKYLDHVFQRKTTTKTSSNVTLTYYYYRS